MIRTCEIELFSSIASKLPNENVPLSTGYGNATAFTLPGSGLVGEYATNYIQPPAGIAPGPTFAPDIVIGTRSTDFFARYDPVMGAILARTDHEPAAPSGDAIAVNAAGFRAEQGLAP